MVLSTNGSSIRGSTKLRPGIYQEGWMACLKKLSIPADHLAWTKPAKEGGEEDAVEIGIELEEVALRGKVRKVAASQGKAWNSCRVRLTLPKCLPNADKSRGTELETNVEMVSTLCRCRHIFLWCRHFQAIIALVKLSPCADVGVSTLDVPNFWAQLLTLGADIGVDT
ncbi:hypothetical protein Acr_26g0003720 [Actinidia rufa]|uniref:Uncharacterized protein n=1 Tax=Actinidia rufa TaxID=165716 RepID=A0A7J0H235_9ERIC|nr:hypothetical protein Acr_26g0003720 [Actinidia rufa]